MRKANNLIDTFNLILYQDSNDQFFCFTPDSTNRIFDVLMLKFHVKITKTKAERHKRFLQVKMSTLNNTTLKAYYPNLMFLFDLFQSHLVDIELLKEEDEDEYKNLFTTSIINADTAKSFPRVKKNHDLVNCKKAFFTVSYFKKMMV